MNTSMFRVPIMAWFTVLDFFVKCFQKIKVFLPLVAMVATLNTPVVWAELGLERTTTGNDVGTPAKWWVTGIEEVESVNLHVRNLGDGTTGDFLVPISDAPKRNNDADVLISYKFKKAAIYTVQVSSADNESDEIIQIVGPAADESERTSENDLFKGCNTETVYDVIVVDGTSAGVGAAIAAAKDKNLTVCLLEPANLVGGMFTNGIGQADIGMNKLSGQTLSYGIFNEFANKMEENVSLDTFVSPPKKNRLALYEMLKKDNLFVQINSRFSGQIERKVAAEGKYAGENIFSLSFYVFDGKQSDTLKTYSARYVVDATDSGDVAVAYGDLLGVTANDSKLKCKDDEKNGNVFCVRTPTQLYSMVLTIKEYENGSYHPGYHWSRMNYKPPRCDTEGIYTDMPIQFKEYANESYSADGKQQVKTSWTFKCNAGYLTPDTENPDNCNDTNPLDSNYSNIYQVKHHTGLGIVSYDEISDHVEVGTPNSKCSYEKFKNLDISKLGDELLDCNAYGTGVSTGYALSNSDSNQNRLKVIERYIDHTVCFLYNTQRIKKEANTLVHVFTDLETDYANNKVNEVINEDKTTPIAQKIDNSNIGLTRDQDSIRGNFPARIYIREGRRIKGHDVLIEPEGRKYKLNDFGYIPSPIPGEPSLLNLSKNGQ